MGVTDTQSYSLVIRDVFYDAVAGDPFFANYTKRKTPMLRVQPELLPYLAVYFIDEDMAPDGDCQRRGDPLQPHAADRLLGDAREQRPGEHRAHARRGVLADHEPAVDRPVHHEPARHDEPEHRREQSRQRAHRGHHQRAAAGSCSAAPRSPTKRRWASCNTTASVFYRSIWSPVITDDLDEIAVRTGVKPGDTQADMDQRLQVRGGYLFDISKRPLKKERVK